MPVSANTLATALAAVQKELPAVGKDGTNPHFRNRFVTLDNLIDKTRPVLNKHGLAITQFPTLADTGQPTLTTRLSHVSGESIEYAMPLFLTKQDMQSFGSAITYARRYAWAAALGIASEDDDDGNHATSPAPSRSAERNGNDRAASASVEQVDALLELAADLVTAERVTVSQVASAAGGNLDATAAVADLRPLLAALDATAASALLTRLERYAENLAAAQ